MIQLVDIVNFNADASCLSSGRWLDLLHGGKRSALCLWLQLYVDLNKKTTLGFTGGTVADIVAFNPEAIELINGHPDIFEIILRPFSHDIALLRSNGGFKVNLDLGREVLTREFKRVTDYFLPPEFMLTNEQVRILARAGVKGVFVNAARFEEEIRSRIPDEPYVLVGVCDARLNCIPVHGHLTDVYLHSLHQFDGRRWNHAVRKQRSPLVRSWRDGESCFLVPNSVERERRWLAGESRGIQRLFLSEALREVRFEPAERLGEGIYRSYPVHSFSAWFREFRMLGYLRRLEQYESRLDGLSREMLILWLQAINSDVLSAIEKKSPVISLKRRPRDRGELQFTLLRSERGIEGEECLALLEDLAGPSGSRDHLLKAQSPHMKKIRARMDYFSKRAKRAE